MHDDSIPAPKQNNPIQQPQQELNSSMNIILPPPIMINLDDDDEVAKIDEEVHNELNTLFSSFMSLNDKSLINSVEPSTSPSLTLAVFPLASFPSLVHVSV